MKVILTGGTGTIGGSILEALVAGDHEVVLIVRNVSKAQALVGGCGPKVSLYELNTSQDIYDAIYNAAKGHHNIIHSGFYFSPQDAEYEGKVISAFVDAAKETSTTGHVNLLVTTGALCQGETFYLAGEDEATNANCHEFAKPRVPHEELVINANSDTLHASIIRPVCIYSGSIVDTYFKACKTHGKILVPQGNGTTSYIHRDDVGVLYRLVLENSGTGYFTISEGQGPNLDQVIDLVKSITEIQEVERVDNAWEHIQSYGFMMFAFTLTIMLDSKRARELYGYQPKYNFLRDSPSQLKLE